MLRLQRFTYDFRKISEKTPSQISLIHIFIHYLTFVVTSVVAANDIQDVKLLHVIKYSHGSETLESYRRAISDANQIVRTTREIKEPDGVDLLKSLN